MQFVVIGGSGIQSHGRRYDTLDIDLHGATADLGDGRHTSTEIAAHMSMNPKELSVRRAGLIKKGLIYNPIATQLDFTVPQFAAYLRRIHPYDPNQRPKRGRPRRSPPPRS